MKKTDITIENVSLYFLPVNMRTPLKFGNQTLTSVTCARVKMTVKNREGKMAAGWGETPLNVGWTWPSDMTFDAREKGLKDFCLELAKGYHNFSETGHPMEIGHAFLCSQLECLLTEFNQANNIEMPTLASLVCCSAFDIALHDAYGVVNDIPIYDTYNTDYMNKDLASYLIPTDNTSISFDGLFPQDYFVANVSQQLPVWHLVGGKDPIEKEELTGAEINDDYPVLLREWIDTDKLNCLKIKLRGTDSEWDYQRILQIGKIAKEKNVDWLTADFNCTVTDPDYVNAILDKLLLNEPETYGKLLYIEQPFPYDLEKNRIDVHSLSARKPLFMDESAHDWTLVKLGRSLGWTGVALKTCKTQTGAILSACWAKAHGMTLMVQDLTNPMLAMIPHVQLAAHVGTIMGIECNGMQFYPEASLPEQEIHPGLYKRNNGIVDISTINGPGFGYCLDDMNRTLPEASYS